MPIIPPNNTTGLYGIDTTVSVNNTVTGNNLNITGNASIGGNLAVGGEISAVGNIAGNYILGNGALLTGLPEVYGNANVSNYLASGTNTANIITAGNVAGDYFIGNGSLLTGIVTSYNDSNVATFLANFGSNTIVTTGNITGGNFIGSGAALTSLTGANVTGTVPLAAASTATHIAVKNTSGGTLTKGTPVYATGTVGASTTVTVSASRADTAGTMACIGLLETTLDQNDQGYAISVGTLTGTNTNTYTTGQELYVGATGGLTATRPTGTNIVQSVGVVGRVNNSSGSIEVNIWNSYGLPNLSNGKIWQGDASGYPVEVTPYGDANVAAYLPTYTGNLAGSLLTISGNATIAGNLTVTGNTYVANVQTLEVQDPIIGLGRGPNNTPLTTNDGKDRGLDLWYYTTSEQQAFVGYDNSAGKMVLANNVSITNEVVTVNSYGNTVVGNLESTTVSASGNITASAFVGSGAGLTSIPGANVTGTVANATYATSAGSATTATSATTAATVTTNAQPNITSVGTLSTLSVSGNINTGGNINAGGQMIYSGGYSAIGNIVGGNVLSYGAITADGNIFAARYFGDGGFLSNVSGALPNNISISGNISAGGNITATGNIRGSFVQSTGNLSVTGNAFVNNLQTNESIIVGKDITLAGNLFAAGSYVNAGFLNATSNITGGNIISNAAINTQRLTATGNVTAGNISTTGQISATGNVTAGNFIGTFVGSISSANVANYTYVQGVQTNADFNVGYTSGLDTYARVYGDNGGGFTYNPDSNLLKVPTISATGNVTAANFFGSGAGLSSITGANVTGTVANATYATSAGSATTATSATTAGTVTTNAQPNITSVGTLTSLSATGNIQTSAYFLGDGSLLTNLPTTAPGGSNTQIQFNNAGAFGGDALLTFDTATGTTTASNVSIQSAILNNVNAFDANVFPNPFRITVGNGYDGQYGNSIDPLGVVRNPNFAVITKQTSTTSDTNQGVRAMQGYVFNDLNGQTHTNNTRRTFASGGLNWLGNGTIAMTSTQYLGAAGQGGTVAFGNIGGVNMGNVTVGHSAATINTLLVGAGANVGNLVGSFTSIQSQATSANITTAIGSGMQFTVVGTTPTTAPTTVIGYYMPGTTGTYGMSSNNLYRGATNYYFLMNEDDVAQNRLGSLRRYHEFNGVSGTTSGSLTIDKNNGQVQQVNLTGNVTSLGFSNFVSSASDGTNTDEECDTVTVIFNQGTTGNYGVTFPTGSTYKYAGNVTTLNSVAANSVSLMSVSAVRLSGTTTYLITISPGFV